MELAKKVILKITGEAFSKDGQGLNKTAVLNLAKSIVTAVKSGYHLGVVNGGGNLVRGRNAKNLLDHLKLDYQGLAATVKNGQTLEKALKSLGVKVKLVVSVPYKNYSVFNGKQAEKYLNNYEVVILAGGTGLPFFSTDTAAVLRGLQMNVPIIWKASNVDGVYSADPKKDPQAKLLPSLTTAQALENHYAVVDQAALALSMEHKVSWRVFKYSAENILAVANGKKIGSLIK